MPTREPLDLLDPEVWLANSWGLADPDQDSELQKLLPEVPIASRRREIAVEHLRRNLALARRAQEALDVPAQPPDGLTIHLIGGDSIATPARAMVTSARGDLIIGERQPGDGTVTRSSALMDERESGDWARRVRTPIHWDSVLFLPADHLGMTESPTFTSWMTQFKVCFLMCGGGNHA